MDRVEEFGGVRKIIDVGVWDIPISGRIIVGLEYIETGTCSEILAIQAAICLDQIIVISRYHLLSNNHGAIFPNISFFKSRDGV